MKFVLSTLLSQLIRLLGAQSPQETLEATVHGSNLWIERYGAQKDLTFTGPLSFSHLPYSRCLEQPLTTFDLAVLGMPFDTAVTYRPGARFGPFAIRSGSRRQGRNNGYSLSWMNDPYASAAKIVDCGDVPVSAFDNALAIDQMEVAYSSLLRRRTSSPSVPGDRTHLAAKDGVSHPRIVTLGGDHTIVLPILRSLYQVYGPISVIHFDAHIDTWPTTELYGYRTEQERITHGTFFTKAFSEGLVSNTSIHAGIRCKLEGMEVYEHDAQVGFQLIHTDDIDEIGVEAIIKEIRERVGDSAVYLSFDIDTIDPGQAPATGTPEVGGWSMREVKRIIRGLTGLNFVGADIVEVAPAYDSGDITGIAAADLAHDFLSMLLLDETPQRRRAMESSGVYKSNKIYDEL